MTPTTDSPLIPRLVPFGSGSLTGSRFPPPPGNRNRSDRFPNRWGTGSRPSNNRPNPMTTPTEGDPS